MRIRITGAKKNTYWYAGKIGEVFEVTGGSTDYSGGVLVLHDGSRDRFVVQLGDYEIITEDSTPITVLPDDSLGGIKREYREVKRKASAEERIKIIAIHPDSLKVGSVEVGEVFTVSHVDGSGDVWSVEERDIRGIISDNFEGTREYVVLEPTDVVYVDDSDGVSRKYRMVDRNAAVGERVIALRDCGIFYKRGNVGAVRGVSNDGSVRVYFSGKGCNVGDGIYYLGNDIGYRVLEPIGNEEAAAPTPLSTRPATEQTAENIAALTAKVQTLESRVHSLEARVKALEVGEELLQELPQKVADGLAELFEGPSPKSQQQIRDEIVERAKADVKALLDRNYPSYEGYHPSIWFTDKDGACITDKCEFVVNREKRTVVALISVIGYGKPFRKGIAKCAPNDVFNVWIGKAIALRRALGLEVPAEYLSVPNPTEIRVGDIVKYRDGTRIAIVGANGDQTLNIDTHTYLSTAVGHEATIIDDSREEADDSVSSTKGAAA